MTRFFLLALASLALVARSQNPPRIPIPPEFLAIGSLTVPELQYRATPLQDVIADLNARIKTLAPEESKFRIEIPSSIAKGLRARITLEKKGLSVEAVLHELSRQAKAEIHFTTDRILLIPPTPAGMEAVLPDVSFRNTRFIDAMNQLSVAAAKADPNQLEYPIRVTPGAAQILKNRTVTLEMKKEPLRQVLQTIFRAMQPPPAVVLRADAWEATIAGVDEPDPIEVAGGAIMQRAAKIVLPAVQFKESTLSEVFAQLQDKAKAADPRKRGIAMELSAAAKELPIRITLTLRNVPLSKALVYVANLAELECKPRSEKLIFSVFGEE